MECDNIILYSLQNLTNLCEEKACALYVISFLGHPNLDKICDNKKSIITISIPYLVGMASTHLVKKFVAVSIHLCFPEEIGLISPIKSQPHY